MKQRVCTRCGGSLTAVHGVRQPRVDWLFGHAENEERAAFHRTRQGTYICDSRYCGKHWIGLPDAPSRYGTSYCGTYTALGSIKGDDLYKKVNRHLDSRHGEYDRAGHQVARKPGAE